jgi:hypothetical protein
MGYNQFMRPAPRPEITLAGLVLLLAGLGCSLTNATPVAWSRTAGVSPTSPGVSTPDETAPPTRSPATQAPTQTATGEQPGTARLLTSYPSLVYASTDQETLLVWDPAEQHAAQITLPCPLQQPTDLNRGASPTGAFLALRCLPAGETGPLLLLVSLADGAIRNISPLLSGEIIQASGEESPPDALQAVQDPDAIRWSPDGRSLAFVAALQGPSADLYVYTLEDENLRRLTHGSGHAATPIWSPDMRWILVQDVETFGSGAGWRVNSVYAVSATTDEIRAIYTPASESGGEVFPGWLDPENVVAYTWTPAGARDARQVPISARAAELIYEGPFDTLAFDPSSRWFVFTIGQPGAAQAGLVPGLYDLVPGSRPRDLIQAGEWRSVDWIEKPGLFTASGVQGALLVNPQGDSRLYPGEGGALPSPDGLWVAAWGDERYNRLSGARLYQPDGKLLEEITGESVQKLIWYPNSQTFFYQSGENVYQVSFPGTRPVLIGDQAVQNSLSLVPSLDP